ncbi:MAG: packaged DNA stabilization protein [Methylocella sp.]
MNVQFATNSYQLKAPQASTQRTVNFYAEKEPDDVKSPIVVYGVFGLTQLIPVGDGPIRGLHAMNNVLYVVSADELWSVNTLGDAKLLGTGIAGGAFVSMADNGTQVCIVNGMNGFIYNATTMVFQVINDPNFFPANTVPFMDGFFLFDRAGTNQVFFSQLFDGTTFNALDFFSAEVDSDFVLGTVNQQENLLIIGQRTIETWFDSGNNNDPFQRFNGTTIERGAACPLSTIKEDNSVFFLGNDRIFYRLDLPLPKRISTSAIEQQWQNYQTVADCFVFKATFEGHKFLFVTFPSANATWVYDIESNLWHERISFSTNAASLGRWRGNCSEVFNNSTVIGDAFGNQIGIPSSNVYTEYGAQILGMLISPPIQSDRKRVFLWSFELDCQTGVGLPSGQGSNPQVFLETSKDGGITYGPLQKWKSLGKAGEYLTRLRWTRFGQARQWVLRLTVSDPVRRTIIAAHAEIQKADI